MSLSYTFLMPPMIFIVLALLGILASWRWRRTATVVAALSILLLYACSTRLVSSWLLALAAEQPMPRTEPQAEPEAIVLVVADARWGSLPGEQDWPGPLTLERIVTAARLHRSLGLPVLVTGGIDKRSGKSFAAMASGILEKDFGVPVRWREERSTNTFENAAFSTPMLIQDGISSALIVTQDWDKVRAAWSFQKAGIIALPAPAGVSSSGAGGLEPADFLPGYHGFQDSFYALHELLGLQYYRWRYGMTVRR